MLRRVCREMHLGTPMWGPFTICLCLDFHKDLVRQLVRRGADLNHEITVFGRSRCSAVHLQALLAGQVSTYLTKVLNQLVRSFHPADRLLFHPLRLDRFLVRGGNRGPRTDLLSERGSRVSRRGRSARIVMDGRSFAKTRVIFLLEMGSAASSGISC